MWSTSSSSSRRGTYKTAGMDRRPRTSSIAPEGLLGRQLASIADTLAKASQRREVELQDRKMRDPTAAEQEFWQNLSVTSQSVASRDSDSDKSRADYEQLQKDFEEVAMRSSRTIIDMAKAIGTTAYIIAIVTHMWLMHEKVTATHKAYYVEATGRMVILILRECLQTWTGRKSFPTKFPTTRLMKSTTQGKCLLSSRGKHRH